MAKKLKTTGRWELSDSDTENQTAASEPRIHVAKYLAMHPIANKLSAELIRSRFASQMHTEAAWPAIIDAELHRSL